MMPRNTEELSHGCTKQFLSQVMKGALAILTKALYLKPFTFRLY